MLSRSPILSKSMKIQTISTVPKVLISDHSKKFIYKKIISTAAQKMQVQRFKNNFKIQKLQRLISKYFALRIKNVHRTKENKVIFWTFALF